MPDDNHGALREVLLEALKLKEIPRTGWLRVGVDQPESVAAHSWGVAWLVLVLCPRHVDRGVAIAMAVLHDLAEVRTGDLTPHCGVEPDEKRLLEGRALRSLLRPTPDWHALWELWEEFEGDRSLEARFVRACDKLDLALQAQLYARDGLELDEFVESALAQLTDRTMRALAGAPESVGS